MPTPIQFSIGLQSEVFDFSVGSDYACNKKQTRDISRAYSPVRVVFVVGAEGLEPPALSV